MCYTDKVEYYSAFKKEEIPTPVLLRMDLEKIVLNENPRTKGHVLDGDRANKRQTHRDRKGVGGGGMGSTYLIDTGCFSGVVKSVETRAGVCATSWVL